MGLATTLKNLSPSLYRLRIVTATVLVLLIPFLVYYLFYVRSQNAYFTERGFRSLSLSGQQIALKVESAGEVLKNASERFVNPKEDVQTTIKYDAQVDEQTNLANLATVLKNLKDGGPEIVPVRVQSIGQESQTTGFATITDVREEDGAPWLYLNYETSPNNEKKVIVVKAKTNFSQLLQPLLDRRDNRADSPGDEFQDMLIADAASGKVMFQLDQTGLRLASVDKLTSSDNDQKKIEIKEISQTSNLADIRLAGSSFKLFLNPLRLSLVTNTPNGSENTSWIVCGLVSAEQFRAETWSVSYTLLILCAFVTALLVLHWPFIKLVLIGPKDRLRTADVYFLTFSTIVVLAVLTSFGLYGYSYLRISGLLDDQLKSLAATIKWNVNDELRKALHQLNSLSSDCELLRVLGSSAPCKSIADDPFYHQKASDRTNILPDLLATSDHSYPYFDTAAWINNNGWQKAKWTIKGSTTRYLNASSRAYFKDLRHDDYHELDQTKFGLEPIVSKTTGRNEVEISVKTPDDAWITAFDTRLISLMRPVLPAGFGYLIVNKDGNVLFHSNEVHHLGENFLKECDEDPEVRSAILSRNGLPLNVRYLGQDHSIVVTSLDGFPDWSLIVFRNKQTVRSAFLELVSLVSLLFLAYSFVLMIALSLFYLVNFNNDRRAWLWPSRAKTNVYYQSLVLNLVLSLISIPLIFFVHGQALVGFSILISFLAIFIFFLHLRRNLGGLLARIFTVLPGDSAKKLWRYDIAYSLNLAILLLVVAILPAIAFYKFAFEAEMGLFIKHGQFTLASALAQRDQLIRGQYAEIVGSEVAASFIPGRMKLPWDIYDHFFFNTERSDLVVDPAKCESQPTQQQLLKLTRLLPLYNQTSIERRGLLLNSSASGVCKWESSPAGQLILHLEGAAARDVPWRHLKTDVPGLGVPGPVWSLLFILTLIPFFLWVSFIVRKVFLLDVHRPSSKPLRVLLQTQPTRNLFIVLDSPFTEESIATSSNIHLLDLPTLANAPDWANTIAYADLDKFQAIAVDNFAYRLDDAMTNRQKLYLLETLISRQRKVIVLSAAEPSLFQFGNGDLGTHEKGHDDAGHWAGLMSQFFKEYAEDTADSAPFKEKLNQEKEKLLANLKDSSAERVTNLQRLLEIVATECAHRPALQYVGINIVEDPQFSSLTPDHLINRIVSQARAYYLDIWNTCSLDEKLTLFHLAQDRLLSHRDPDIEPLLRRGLIVRNDDLHLMNDSFREFVKSAEQTTICSEHEARVKRSSLWNTLKVPFLIVLVGITLFLFVTQHDLYTSALAGLTAVTTIIPAIFKVFTVFQSEPVAHSPGTTSST